jgi:deoxyribodipyrimidine photolyase-related protein
MKKIGIVFPHQLFENNPLTAACSQIYLVEECLFFKQYNFHKQKLAFHRAGLKYYEWVLKQKNISCEYIPSGSELSDTRNLLIFLSQKNIKEIHCIHPEDDWLEKRLTSGCKKLNLVLRFYPSPMFMNTSESVKPFFEKTTLRQTSFYIEQRKKWKILLNADGKPEGGKWTFDEQNRSKYPKGKTAPFVQWPSPNNFTQEAKTYVELHFSENPGNLGGPVYYPVTHNDARIWLRQFLENRFYEFGRYQDSMVRGEILLHHSLLSPLLNSGILTPEEVIQQSILFAGKNNIPINSLEGFIRQILGWREFLRGVYIYKGGKQRTTNFWKFNRKIPKVFWTAETGILPVDDVIRKILKTGYAHHIERLMILGNFMLLCEFEPDEVYRWFMELFTDALDWVMVPNVYGMSQFADGGLMATKPYISSSNYILKMSNYPKGDWQEVWDALFWRFMNKHRFFFQKNPRLNMLIGNFDKMPAEKQNDHFTKAEEFLQKLDKY